MSGPYQEEQYEEPLLDEESKSIVERVIMAVSIAVSICYGVLIALPTGFHTKVTQIWSFYIGLWNCTIKMDTLAGGLIKQAMKGIIKATNSKEEGEAKWAKMKETLSPGDHSIQQLRDQFCNIELLSGGFLNNCWTWSQFMYGSWILGFCLVITIVFLIAGAGLLCAPPTKCIRYSALGMYAAAALFNAGGTGSYVVLTFNLNRWLLEIYGSHDGLTFSMASIFTGALTIIVVLLPVMVWTCSALPRGFDDEYDDCGPPVDQYGNPLPVDQYGNPLPVDQYGNPLPPPGAGAPPGAYPDPNAGGWGQDPNAGWGAAPPPQQGW